MVTQAESSVSEAHTHTHTHQPTLALAIFESGVDFPTACWGASGFLNEKSSTGQPFVFLFKK